MGKNYIIEYDINEDNSYESINDFTKKKNVKQLCESVYIFSGFPNDL